MQLKMGLESHPRLQLDRRFSYAYGAQHER